MEIGRAQTTLNGGITMKTKIVGMLLVVLLAFGFIAIGAPPKPTKAVAGGTETMLGPWMPGHGTIMPGGQIRGWKAQYQDNLIGPAADLASGVGPVTMNCNLDENLTGPCWGTFEFTNSKGTWEGAWEGTFNFVTGAGSYAAEGHGRGGLEGMFLQNDVVYPGGAVTANLNGVVGFIYSTVTIHSR
jgi:hypothetical protein